MKNKILSVLLLIIFLSTSSFLNAQSFKWVSHQSHNIPFNPDLTSFVTETDQQGNSILASINTFKLSYNGYYGDVSVRKYNSSGLQIFNKIMYGKILIDGLQTDQNGNIYITGTFMDTLRIDQANYILNTGSGFDLNSFMIKLTENGDFVWKKNISALYTEFVRVDGMRIKNNFLYAGLFNFSDSYIKKFDLNGNEVMSIIQTPVRGISGVDVDAQGNIFSAGACSNGNINFGGVINSTNFSYNVYFVKYNANGVYQWSRFVQDATFSSIDIACDHSGNLYASGNLSGSFMFGNIQAQGSQWVYDFFLTKIDAAGNFLWLKEVPNTPTLTGDAGKAKVNALAVDIQDNVYFTGFLRSTVNWGNNIVTTSKGYSDMLILKYDRNGNILMGKRTGGTGSNRIDDVAMDNAGNVFISGNFSSSAMFDTIAVTGSGNINSFVAKYQVTGNIDLKLIAEGFYDLSSDKMRIQDAFKIYLRNSAAPYAIVDSSSSVIDPVTFSGSFPIMNAASGSYYIQTSHRNSLETWSAVALNYTQSGNANYDFTNSSSNAFGNNVAQVNSFPLRFGFYSGDVNHNGSIDLSDVIMINNDVSNFLTGYNNSDVNGDSISDLSDIIIAFNNSTGFVSVVRP